MKKKYFIAAAVTVAAMIGGLYGYRSQIAVVDSDMLLTNAEALAEVENDDPMWNIDPYNCTISGELAAKLGITVKGEGTVSVSGARDCRAGGNSLCKPISCVDIYMVLK